MFLHFKNSGKYRYLYLLESYLDKDRKPRNRIVKSYGRVDNIPAAELEKLQEQYRSASIGKQARQDEASARLRRLIAAVENNLSSETTPGAAPLLHYGHLLLKPLWEDELGMKRKLDYEQQGTRVASYRINDAVFYLTALKLIDPCSQLKAFEAQSAFFANPIAGMTLDNLYRTLDFLGERQDELMKYAAKHTMGGLSSKPKLLFYDCTNCYFETPYDDLEQFRRRYRRKRAARLREAGLTWEQADAFLNTDDFIGEMDAAADAECDKLLRRRGLSKEHRYDLPLISVALVIDDRGMPLDFQIYHGNKSEYKSMRDSIGKLKRKYEIADAYLVADRGLNSTENLSMLLDEGLGFVVAQQISSQSAELRKLMLDPQGYQSVAVTSKYDRPLTPSLQDLTYKTCEHRKTSYVCVRDGVRKKLSLSCKIMFTFSPRRRRRDLKQLEQDVAKASAAARAGKLMGRSPGAGWRGLVQTRAEKDGDNRDIYRAAGLKERLIEERAQTSGYAAIVFSPSPQERERRGLIGDAEILMTYHHQLRIEECFRVMKNNFSLRPMHVRLEQRIKGHCLICVMALILLRMVELKLAESGFKLSADRIASALRGATLAALGDRGATEDLLFVNCRYYSDIFTAENLGSGSRLTDEDETSDTEKLGRSYLKRLKEQGNDTEILMKALGFKAMPKAVGVKEVGRILKVRCANRRQALGEVLSSVS